eukprot:gene3984-4952_t
MRGAGEKRRAKGAAPGVRAGSIPPGARELREAAVRQSGVAGRSRAGLVPLAAREQAAEAAGSAMAEEGQRAGPVPPGAAAGVVENEADTWLREYSEYPWGWDPPGARAHSIQGIDRKVEYVGASAKARFTYGQRPWDAVGAWLQRLRWPPRVMRGAEEGVTWIELAIDFEVWSGLNLPPEMRAMRAVGYDVGYIYNGSFAEAASYADVLSHRPTRGVARPAAGRGRMLATVVRRMATMLGKPMFPGRDCLAPKNYKPGEDGPGLCVVMGRLGMPGHSKGTGGFIGLELRPVPAGGKETGIVIFEMAQGNMLTPAEFSAARARRQKERGRVGNTGKEKSGSGAYLDACMLGAWEPKYKEERAGRAERWWGKDPQDGAAAAKAVMQMSAHRNRKKEAAVVAHAAGGRASPAQPAKMQAESGEGTAREVGGRARPAPVAAGEGKAAAAKSKKGMGRAAEMNAAEMKGRAGPALPIGRGIALLEWAGLVPPRRRQEQGNGGRPQQGPMEEERAPAVGGREAGGEQTPRDDDGIMRPAGRAVNGRSRAASAAARPGRGSPAARWR